MTLTLSTGPYMVGGLDLYSFHPHKLLLIACLGDKARVTKLRNIHWHAGWNVVAIVGSVGRDTANHVV